MYDNSYTFDLVGNILGLDNTASPVNGMGGGYSHGFSYDAFNRLAGATGSWLNAADNNYQLTMGYEGMHRIQSKHQQHNLNANPVAENEYEHEYRYEHQDKPNALTAIVANGQESETFTYDLNGNVLHHNRVWGESRRVVWDELTYPKGRMSGGHSVSEPSAPARGLHEANTNIADAAVQHHLYDAQGERGLKGLGTITEFYVKGETKGYGASLGNYVRYVSGYFVVDGHGRVSKHYYAGAERVVSRLAGDVAGYLEAEDLEGEQLSTLRTRQQRDVQAAIKTWDLQIFPFLNYPKPTDNCSLYPSDSEEHKQCICDQQNTCTEVLYWYHPDHLGSSTFLSDAAGEPYQFVLYLSFGELFAEQRAAEWSTPYLFNAKELDTETGLYYYGARYYDPRVSTWWGVDPMASKYPGYSPYNYTLNNPVRYIDPDGRDVIVGEQIWTPGATWEGLETDFGHKVFRSLNELYHDIQAGNVSTKERTGNVILDFVGPDAIGDVHIIAAASDESSFTSDAGTQIIWNPNLALQVGPTSDGKNVEGEISPTTILAHEFGHAWLSQASPILKSAFRRVDKTDDQISEHAWILQHVENPFARARNEAIRSVYRGAHNSIDDFKSNLNPSGMPLKFGDYWKKIY